MGTLEKKRLEELERLLSEAQSNQPKVKATWAKANKERQDLDRNITRLYAEIEDLRQGQLMLKMA